jgi:hypothetical protein
MMQILDHPKAGKLMCDTHNALQDLTFRQLHGKPLIEPVTAGKHPYSRALLCFMANVPPW